MNTLPLLHSALADRYRIERELGAGGMATVYIAQDVRHRRKVALKVLHPELSAVIGPERFLKEIELTASLQHPHILPLFDSGEAGGQLFYVMPFVDGETLRARLDREKQLPIAEALLLVGEVADALQYAHERGVIHRDIKPENILLQGGHALVADFGIALAVQQAGGTRMTQTGLSLGTPQYMSPEQAMGERTIDARGDVYALGAVTYEMLAGEPPFTGATSQAIIARVLTVPPVPIMQTRSTVPPHVEQAVLTALQKLPADRFASAHAFAEALRTESYVGGGHGVPPRITSARSAHRSTQIASAVAVAFAVTTLLAVVAWQRSARASESAPVTRVLVGMPEGQEFRTSTIGAATIAITPDGRRFVYVGAASTGSRLRGQQLYIRSLDELEAHAIPGTIGADRPRISPDGQSVFFPRLTGAFIVSLASGQSVAVPGDAWDAAWSPSGALYVLRGRGALDRISGARVETLLVADTLMGRRRLSLLPDDRGVLLTSARVISTAILQFDASNAEITALSFKSGKQTSVVAGVFAQYLPTGQLLFVKPDGTVLVAPFDLESLQLTGSACRYFA